jgi:asparagine synthase (glutamine-hydrolysing)
MVASLAARGPDDEGLVRRDWFALGIRRLAIVAVDAGRQPVSTPSGDVTLAFNGEIYDYEEIARALRRADGIAVRSEAEALLALYLSRGLDFTRRLNGDYAIVVCDTRARACHLFRDPFGVKPLYYAPLSGGRAWAAASEVQAFFHHPGFSTDWDEIALSERRVLGFCASDRTNFAAIRQVPPGARVTLAGSAMPSGRPTVVEAASDPGVAGGEMLDLDSIDLEGAARLDDAVARRIRHSERFPVVVALSGGIDSTIIARCAARMPAGQVASLTIGGGDGGNDERIAGTVARRLSLPHRFERVDTDAILRSYPRLILALGAQGAAYSAYFIGAAVRRRWPGAKVMLCGEGADELFLGYWMHVHPAPYTQRVVDVLATLPPEWVDRSPLLRMVAAWPDTSPRRVRARLNALLRTHQLVNRHLVPFDHGTMAHSIECRVPYLDREVARWIASVPEVARTAGNTAKVVLRVIASDLLEPLGIDRVVLDRQPSALPAAVGLARTALVERIARRSGSSGLPRGRLARFANTPEELFWLAAVEAVFLRHRARIDGMDFDALEAEILHAAG